MNLTIWLRLFVAVATEKIDVGQFEAFAKLIRPWKASGDGPVILAEPMLSGITDMCVTAEDKDSCAKRMAEAFFSDPLARLLKSPDPHELQSLCKLLVSDFEAASAEDGLLEGIDDAFVDPFDEIMQCSRALLALSEPQPTASGYDDVTAIFDPEATGLSKQIVSLRATVKQSRDWSNLIDEFWAGAVNDAGCAEEFERVKSLLDNDSATIEDRSAPGRGPRRRFPSPSR